MQAPPPLSLCEGESRVIKSRESICCLVPSSQARAGGGDTLHCNSADDPRFVVTSSGEGGNGGLQLYCKRVKSPEFEVNEGSEKILLLTGQAVRVLRRVQHWVKVQVQRNEQGLIGWCELFTHVSSVSNSSSASSGKGSNYGYIANLVPMHTLEWTRHGAARPLATSCGHAIHSSCWDT